MTYLIFHGSYLVFPFLVLLIWLKWKKRLNPWVFGILTVLSFLFIYGRFIERYLIIVREENIIINPNGSQELTIAVVSDFHLGLYKGESFLKRVVEKINEAEADLVLEIQKVCHLLLQADLSILI